MCISYLWFFVNHMRVLFGLVCFGLVLESDGWLVRKRLMYGESEMNNLCRHLLRIHGVYVPSERRFISFMFLFFYFIFSLMCNFFHFVPVVGYWSSFDLFHVGFTTIFSLQIACLNFLIV